MSTTGFITPPWAFADRTALMAVLNVTPDSFSDGGRFVSPQAETVALEAVLSAAEAALALGADLLDVGGESTRPGAPPVDAETEARRVLPVVEALVARFPGVCVSVDTWKAPVAREALRRGARVINDITGLTGDPAMARTVAEAGGALVLMHIQGTPQTMQQAPHYQDVVAEVAAFLQRQAALAQAAGIPRDRLMLDPGFGFGKTIDHNLALMRGLPTLKALGYPMLAGTSRKSFLTLGSGHPPADQREALTAASLAIAVAKGADAVRIHDVATQAPVLRWLDRLTRTAVLRDGGL